MDIKTLLDIIKDMRNGSYAGVGRAPRVKPGREIRNGVLHYDGMGPSGYTGRCAQPSLKSLERPARS
jgi:hypothetical protein